MSNNDKIQLRETNCGTYRGEVYGYRFVSDVVCQL